MCRVQNVMAGDDGGDPLPQLQAGAVVAAMHGEGALRQPHSGVHPDPRVQQPRAVTGELHPASATRLVRVVPGQPAVTRNGSIVRNDGGVPSQRLIKIDDHRPWRGEHTV